MLFHCLSSSLRRCLSLATLQADRQLAAASAAEALALPPISGGAGPAASAEPPPQSLRSRSFPERAPPRPQEDVSLPLLFSALRCFSRLDLIRILRRIRTRVLIVGPS